ncbi:MAG TPA: glycosyltransferase family A protein [Rhodopila sp.]|jgi:glycosyltransferase involved in cell wall biosynthesis
MLARWDWNVAVFCRNEQESIGRSIESIARASRAKRGLISLIVNGSTDRSAATALAAAQACGAAIKVYEIRHGDKANAMNRFFYDLRADADCYFFVDGYARIGEAALGALETCLLTRPEVVAATGVATNGRTMSRQSEPTLLYGGQLHGQLHALRKDFIDRMVARRIRVPIGLYYGDGLIGSMAMHDLDPINVAWHPGRIGSSPDATYEIPTLSPFRVRDLRRQFHRKVRQMRGRLENLAIRSIVYVHGYEGLPTYADDMIQAYLEHNPLPRMTSVNRLFRALALRQVRERKRPDPVQMEPVLIGRLEGSQP